MEVRRQEKLEKLKGFLQENYPNAQAYDCQNITGDQVTQVYDKDDIEVWYCSDWDYIEIFGLSKDEFKDLLDSQSFLGNHLKTFEEYLNV